MGAPAVGSHAARIRIKGRWQSVVRFFFIAVGFMMTWVLVTSELAYYSKWFGPQILLELNFAFYLPSIPVLVISGQVEKFLDSRFGPISSMMIRLNFGLAGSAALCAAFPFITKTHTGLLCIVAVLGTLSAVAFSTSYQMVQWFRHADIIGLGIGAVGSGPLVLLIQLALDHVKAWPQRWQWIAQFEITAAVVLLGLLASLSLFGQYWSIMTGVQPYDEARQPLLADEADHAEAGDARTPALHAATSWFPPAEVLDPEEQEKEERMAATLATATTLAFQGGMPVLFRSPSSLHFSHYERDGSAPTLHPRSRSEGLCCGLDTEAWTVTEKASFQHTASPPLPPATAADRTSAPQHAVVGELSEQPPADSCHLDKTECPTPFAGTGAQAHTVHGDPSGSKRPYGRVSGASAAHSASPVASLTLMQETQETMTIIWPVIMSFFVSVTIMYLIFPFFTYIPSSGYLGDTLPRVLFFTRIGADTLGRFAPRIKSLVTHSPNTLSVLSVVEAILAVLILVYMKVADRFHHDLLPVAAVVMLWAGAGYVNTCANILAPAIVPDRLCPRASALMALAFQVAHFAGLLLAAVLIFVMFGDLAAH